MVRPVGLLCYSPHVQDFLPRCRQQLSDVLVELIDCTRVGAEKREVTVDGLDRPELRIGDEPPFGLAIRRRKNMSDDIGMTNVLAMIRLNAARRSPPLWRLTSPRCHFHAMHNRLFGSIGWK